MKLYFDSLNVLIGFKLKQRVGVALLSSLIAGLKEKAAVLTVLISAMKSTLLVE